MHFPSPVNQRRYPLPEPPLPSPKTYMQSSPSHYSRSGVASLPTTTSLGFGGEHREQQQQPIQQPERPSSRLYQYSPSGNYSPSGTYHYSPSGAYSPTAGQQSSWKSLTPISANAVLRMQAPPKAPQMMSGNSSPFHAQQSQYAQASQANAGAGVNGLIYQVQFKCSVRNYILGSQAHPSIMAGDFVVVEADRGEDIGVVVEILPMKTFVERRIYMKATVDDENVIGRILRLASVAERQFLPEKFHDEENIVQFCRELAYTTYRLPMLIQDVEYQFDRHKLTIYYSSDARVDFREFVRDLFSAYKARIWMKKVVPNKSVRNDNWASVALATGMQFTPDNK
jgi:hypothetical protein